MRNANLTISVALLVAGCTSGSSDPRSVSDAGDETTMSGDSSFDSPLSRDATDEDGGLPPEDASADATAERDAATPDAEAGPGDAAPADAGDGDGGVALGMDCSTDAGHPVELACTGLYAQWPTRTIAPGVRAYVPGVALWSDGAEKSRYIQLPAGTRIDTSDMNEWAFPVGTKLWKEFRLNGQPVETRFLWKRAAGDWFRTTYVWSADGSSATEVTSGVQNVGGGTYEIPSQARCTTCHQGRIDGVLGFEAISLSVTGSSGLTFTELMNEGLLTSPPSSPITIPGNATESAALGWLHANCGNACHNRSPQALAGSTGLFMRLDVATLSTVQTTDTYTTAVNQPSGFQPTPTSTMVRIAPRDLSNSAVYFRDSFRDDQGQGFQMPPIDSHVVPTQGVALVAAWIQSMQ